MFLARRQRCGLLALRRQPAFVQRWKSTGGGSVVPVEIQLTPAEEKLFEVLQFVRKKYAPSATLRVAGGWVRDKVLGIPSDDIDIALDTMTGEAFVKKIVAFQKACGVPIKGFYIVKKNAEQSKHLECAAIKLLGHELDFVHLRSESYSDPTSRIPTLSDVLATPKEDAMRRDITINALFYNLNTKTVEDFTGQGLSDLHRQVIRTPLAPTDTFLDDPLRVLRAIRFASHYDFKLHPSLVQAMQSSQVQGALTQKITRERVGIELRKMLSGANPSLALHWMCQAKLLPIVFPTFFHRPEATVVDGLSTIQFVQAVVAKTQEVKIGVKDQFDHRLMLASALVPFDQRVQNNSENQTVKMDATSIQRMLQCLVHVVFPLVSQTTIHRDTSSPNINGVRVAEKLVVDDKALVHSALAFLSNSKLLDKQHHNSKQRTDAIKHDLKWSNADASHASDVMDGCRRFHQLGYISQQLDKQSQQPHNTPDDFNMVVHLCLWYRLHASTNDLLGHILPIVWHDGQEGSLQHNDESSLLNVKSVREVLEAAKSLASQPKNQRTRFPAPELQSYIRKSSTWQLSDVLHVVAVWEWLHPTASMEDEREFVGNVLALIVNDGASKKPTKANK
ncbi:hypothetical protein, variant 1 [Aphanomyces astaci]|uniref:Poly A polymerase head domain-containing protein n=1 Tax=Aphanomyces astaci TaxID=112090 RepID=W4FKJ1_APHAT|nr:hypothetical protein, variant 1 [Aphanomyces astaci]ETV68007.1 hypothetical protein, variant 1 [Aphanomyces astaci]|eukprot:XP_009842569.1 hypothetical protein, variant 1 [Aphanomyces astaci]